MMKKRFFYSLLACMLALLPSVMRAQTAYALYGVNGDEKILYFTNSSTVYNTVSAATGSEVGTFSYDDKTWDIEALWSGTNVTATTDNGPGWFTGKITVGDAERRYTQVIQKVVFDSSFSTVRPQSLAYWFSGLDTSLPTAGVTPESQAGTSQLTTFVGLENLNTSEVTSLRGTFSRCVCTSLDLHTFDTSNVTSLFGTFFKSHATSINLQNWNTAKVTTMQAMFYKCESLSSIDLRHFDVGKVESMYAIFTYCSALSFLDLSTWDTASLTNMGDCFVSLSNIKILDLSNFDTGKVTSIQWTFRYNPQLTTIYVGANWKEFSSQGGSDVFSNDRNLVGGSGTKFSSDHIDASYARIDDPDNGKPGYMTGSRVFAVYDNTNHVLYLCNRGFNDVYSKRTNAVTGVVETYPDFTPAGGASAIAEANTVVMEGLSDGWDLDALLTANSITKSEITSVVIESTMGTQRPTTLADWFSGMTSLTSVTGLNYLNTTNTTSMANMFKDCSNASFTSLNFSTLPATTANVTDMSGMFEGCTSLTGITFGGNFNTSSVTTMANMFKNCSASGFTTLDLSGFATSNVTDLSGMFSGCANLQYATYADASTNTPFSIGNFDTQLVTDMHDMFSGCAHLPAEFDLSTLYTAEVTNMSGMFNGCTSLTKLNLASFATSKVTNTTNMFNGCSNLVTIYAGLTWDNTQMASSDGMFTGCSNLVGGNHTAYSSSYANKAYALIDDDEHRGYLTEMYPLFLHLYSDRDMSGALSAYNGQRVTAQVHRAFTANVWTTLCLPFNMTADQVTNVFGSGTALKTLQSVTRSGATISTVTYTDATAIEAGKPYLIKPTTAINKETGFTLSSKTILAPTGKSVNSMGFAMRGVLTPTTVSTSSTENFYTLVEDAELPANTFTAGTDYTQVTAAAPASLDGTKAYFSATTDAYVTVTIPSSGDKTYGTASFSSIYDLDFSEVEYGSNMKPEAYIGVWWTVGTTNDGTYLTMARVTDVPAGTGLLIRGTKGATYNIPISRSNVVLTNLLVAVPERKIVYEEEGDYTNYYLSGGVLKKVNGYATVGVGKAYMALPTAQLLAATPSSVSAGAPARFNLIFVDDIENYDETTGIDNVENGGDASAKKVYYNLNGQRVNNPTRGIYIVNGKKVFVK